nr:MAG: P5 protein [Yunnan emara-like virus]
MATYEVLPMHQKCDTEEVRPEVYLNPHKLNARKMRLITFYRLKEMFENDNAEGINSSLNDEDNNGCLITHTDLDKSNMIMDDRFGNSKLLFIEPRSGKSSELFVIPFVLSVVRSSMLTCVINNYDKYDRNGDCVVSGHSRCNILGLKFIVYFDLDIITGLTFVKKNFETILRSTVYSSCSSAMTSDELLNLKNIYYDEMIRTKRESIDEFLFNRRCDILPHIIPSLVGLKVIGNMSTEKYNIIMSQIQKFHGKDSGEFLDGLDDTNYCERVAKKYLSQYHDEMNKEKRRRDLMLKKGKDTSIPPYMSTTLNDFYCYKVPLPHTMVNIITDDLKNTITSEDSVEDTCYNSSYMVPVSLRKEVYKRLVKKNPTIKINNMHLYYLTAMVYEYSLCNSLFNKIDCIDHAISAFRGMAKMCIGKMNKHINSMLNDVKKNKSFLVPSSSIDTEFVKLVADKHYKRLLKQNTSDDSGTCEDEDLTIWD